MNRLLPLLLCIAAAAGPGCSSGDDDTTSGGGAGTGGGATRNVYLNQLRTPGCLPRPLTTDPGGTVPCEFVEVRLKSGPCSCDTSRGRLELDGPSNVLPAVQEYMHNVGECDAQGTPACADFCYCDLRQFSGAELLTCEGAAEDPGNLYGFCYVDPNIDSNGDGTPDANPALLADCPETSKRRLRFLGANVPASDALLFIACEPTPLP